MLTLDITLSIILRVVAFCWALKVVYQQRDNRILLLALMFGLMALRQIFTAFHHGFDFHFVVFTEEFPGLLVSILALLSIIYIEKIYHAPKSNKVNENTVFTSNLKEATKPQILPFVGVFTILLLVAISVGSIQTLENLHKEKHVEDSIILSRLQTTFFEIGNALQESYAYLLSGDVGEKEEYLQWAGSVSSNINQSYKELEGKIEYTEIFDDIVLVQNHIKKSIQIAHSLFSEFEQNNYVNEHSLQIYEQEIDSMTPLIELINKRYTEHIAEIENITHESLHTGKTVINFSLFTLLFVTITFILFTIYLAKKRQDDAEDYFKFQLDQQKSEQILLNSIPAMIWQKDANNNIVNLNQAAAQSIGKSINEIRGKNAHHFYPEEPKDYYKDDIEVLRMRKPKLGIVEQHQEKNRKIWIRTDKYPLFDAEDQVNGVLVVSTDITKEKQAQEELEDNKSKLIDIKDKLIHSERVNMLGQLSSSISHELNQPLSAANQFFSSIKIRLEKLNIKDEKVQSYLNQGIEQIKRASEIIRRIKELSKKQTPQKVETNVKDLVQEVLKILVNELTLNEIDVQLSFATDQIICRLDKIEIQQVLINLLQNSINSLQKIEKNRLILITVQMQNQDQITVTVQDNGPGIPANEMDKIFSAYHTNKTGGIGMGLPICETIIEAHGGEIWPDTDYTAGARFSFSLPT